MLGATPQQSSPSEQREAYFEGPISRLYDAIKSRNCIWPLVELDVNEKKSPARSGGISVS